MNALGCANAVARVREAELKALHVVVKSGLTPSAHVSTPEHGDVMAKLREALSTIDPRNSRVGAAVRQGDPGARIVQVARSLPADVIVMGAAGSERLARPIGSVHTTVVARASCPVLIVPHDRPVDRAAPGVCSGAPVFHNETLRDDLKRRASLVPGGWAQFWP